MRFYGNQFGSSYEELISYYPRYYRDVLEMVAILNAQGKLLDDAKAQIEQNYLNNFIEHMDEAAISDLEEFLEIHNDGTKTLDERKKIIKPYFAGFGRVSSATIKEMIAAYSDATADVRLEPFDEAGNNMLYIDLTCGQGATVLINDVLNMLSKKIPAHIMYRLFLRYTSSAAHSYIGAGYHGTAQRVAAPIVGTLHPPRAAFHHLCESWAVEHPAAGSRPHRWHSAAERSQSHRIRPGWLRRLPYADGNIHRGRHLPGRSYRNSPGPGGRGGFPAAN